MVAFVRHCICVHPSLPDRLLQPCPLPSILICITRDLARLPLKPEGVIAQVNCWGLAWIYRFGFYTSDKTFLLFFLLFCMVRSIYGFSIKRKLLNLNFLLFVCNLYKFCNKSDRSFEKDSFLEFIEFSYKYL